MLTLVTWSSVLQSDALLSAFLDSSLPPELTVSTSAPGEGERDWATFDPLFFLPLPESADFDCFLGGFLVELALDLSLGLGLGCDR